MRQIVFIFLLLFPVAILTATPFPLECGDKILLRQLSEVNRNAQDLEIRERVEGIEKPLLFLGRTFEPLKILAAGGEARIIATVTTDSDTSVLKQFYDHHAFLKFIGGIYQLRAKGIPTVEVLDMDHSVRTVRLKLLNLFLPDDYPQGTVPPELTHRLITARRQLMDQAESLGVLTYPLRAGNVQLDLDAEEFKVIDIH